MLLSLLVMHVLFPSNASETIQHAVVNSVVKLHCGGEARSCLTCGRLPPRTASEAFFAFF